MQVKGRTDFSNERPAYSVFPPAVTRHLLFRIGAKENPRWVSDKSRRRQLWIKFCESIETHIKGLRQIPNDPLKILPPYEESDESRFHYSTRRSAVIELNPNRGKEECRARVRLDVYTEMYSLTYVYDRVDKSSGNDLRSAVDAVLDGSKDVANARWLFDEIWSEGVIKGAVEMERWRKLPTPENPGGLIADFRGIVICPSRVHRMEPPSLRLRDIRAPAEHRMDSELVTFLRRRQRLLRSIAGPHEPDEDQKNQVSGGEAVLCGMLDGKAIYAAELGTWGQDSRQPSRDEVAPVRHLLVYSGRSHSQIGRLIRRLHVLGELRHAALMDYDNKDDQDIKTASRKLRELGKRLNAVFLMPEPGKLSDEELNDLINEMATISAMGEDGLIYRVEQSRYYAGEFRNHLPHLRIVRISNWQPYNDFVSRYIFQLFARIDKVGQRYKAAGNRIGRILSLKQIDGISGNQVNHGRLLRNAELIALTFLVYYTGSALKESVPHPVNYYFVLAWGVVLTLLSVQLAWKISQRKLFSFPAKGGRWLRWRGRQRKEEGEMPAASKVVKPGAGRREDGL